jgi:hypothetical protein
MRIDVKLYGDLKKYAPGHRNQFSLSLDPETTFGCVFRLLYIPIGDQVSLINGRRSDPDAILTDGDTLVFMPQIPGG